MELSIVTTMYCSAPYLNEFYQRIKSAAEKITTDFEIIFVNDGSPDHSLKIAVEIYEQDPRVKIIDLSRNFGHHKAIMTGLTFAAGKDIFLIDCDLEEEPELLEKFWDVYKSKQDIDVIYGVQEKRKGRILERFSGSVFYNMLNFFSGMDMPKNILTARMMSQRYVKSLLQFRENELFLAGLFFIAGFKQEAVTVVKLSKRQSTYSFKRKIALAINSITSFSDKPLRFIANTGIFISFLSFIYILYIIFARIFFNHALVGWSSLIVSVWFVGGLIMFFLGIIGVYVSKIYIETKNRPYTIVRDVYETKY